MEINGRKILAKIEFGSNLYGLQTENSDTDYRCLISPNWDELYLAARRQNKINIGDFEIVDGVDCSIFNIMGLSTQLAIGSAYWLEILWSKKVEVEEVMKPLWEYMVKNRDDISKMQVQALWQNHIKACKKHLKLYEKKGKGSLLHHALRHIYTLERFAKYDNYGKAICYDNDKKCLEYHDLMFLKDKNISEKDLEGMYEHTKERFKNIGKIASFYNAEYTGKHHAYIKEEISKIVKASV